MLKNFAVFSIFPLFPPFRYHDTLWAINKIVNNQNFFAQNEKNRLVPCSWDSRFLCVSKRFLLYYIIIIEETASFQCKITASSS